jgi:hypothetical protein
MAKLEETPTGTSKRPRSWRQYPCGKSQTSKKAQGL